MRIGIDIGGTFTDFVLFDETTGQFTTYKLLSTPHDPAEAVLTGLNQLANLQSLISNLQSSPSTLYIVHGSTVATNARISRCPGDWPSKPA
jgi:N-methylhydantoinase A/oxoprolinase/acetone carboxylase beta subunit